MNGRAAQPLFEIDLRLPAPGSGALGRTLLEQLRAAILDGRLPAGTRLPPTRRSAAQFGVSRNTAAGVYESLLAERLLETRRGAGTFVARALPRRRRRAAATPPPVFRLNEFWLRPEVRQAIGYWDDPEPAPGARSGVAIDCRPALVDAALFPFDVLRKAAAQQLRRLERKPARYKGPGGNQGNHALRLAIARHIGVTRAVACEAEEVLITNGAQQAFDLLARCLVQPGRTVVAIEDPGYPPLRVAFAAAGARLLPVGVDEEGLQVERLPAGVGVVCVTPSHQFPLGMALSARRRSALLDYARRNGAVIVEDDYDGEFRFDGQPLEALRTGDASAEQVFYVGTFSKCMLPSLRLGYLVAPPWALPALVTARNCLDWHSSSMTQLAVAGFLAEGHLERHVRRLRAIYQERRQHLLGLIGRELGEWLAAVPSSYGLHIAATAQRPIDLEAVATRLAREQLRLHTLARYYLGAPAQTGLVLGYGTADPVQLTRVAAALRRALAS
jgi:GntR family transcriptional regulator/MocR family aminotransferase